MTNPVQQATIIQRRAARPGTSVALRASAGSGKTKVLVDRFVRLCVEDGPSRAHPRAILAVTFTRKAAVEIRERLLGRARRMALAEPADLAAELADLFAGRPDPQPTDTEMAAAAGLLETVLEDVSGLNVGTIHSFCQLILGRFAAEAGLDPHFAVLENRDELIDEALERLEAEMARDSALRATAAGVAARPSAVRKALRDALPEQMRIERWLNAHGRPAEGRTPGLPHLLADLRAFLFPDLELERDPEPLDFAPALAAALDTFVDAGVASVPAVVGSEVISRVKEATLEKVRVKAAAAAADVHAALDAADTEAFTAAAKAAQLVFLTGKNEPRKHSAIRKDHDLRDAFNDAVTTEALPVLALIHRIGYIELYRRNRDLLRLLLRLLDVYDELKRRDSVVDFQDLEQLACRLMGDEGSVAALLFRLDDSLRHILLDEFQDTNFNQWDMLRPFVDEFLAGDDGAVRTLFFVGDVKQSIYGFRGAEPVIFSAACDLLAQRGLPVENLPTNFRSVGAVVGGVGEIFGRGPLSAALPEAEREHVRQAWARPETPGPVYILPPFTAEEVDPDNPEDGLSGDQLAARAAVALVRNWHEDPACLTWEGWGDDITERRLHWDDFLVLVRTRTEISLYEQAFRSAGVPFVPAGRGMLAASREVQDVLTLLRWLLWPEDDAALATVLRSPIFRLPADDLQQQLGARDLFKPGPEEGRYRTPDSLWRTLRRAADGTPAAEAAAQLAAWRKHLGFDSAHDLLRRVYRDVDLPERYAAAAGEQARFNLLRLLDVALSPEVAGTPTVRRLVEVLEAAAGRGGQEEGALPRSGAEGRVRIMTVHGAKGLEAPVVLLVDADRSGGKADPRVRIAADDPDTPLLFKVVKEHREGFKLPDTVPWPTDPLQRASATARDRDRAEEANLLYVALTRARDRLVILGGDRASGTPPSSPLRDLAGTVVGGIGAEHVTVGDPPGLTRPPEIAPPTDRDTAAAGSPVRPWEPPPPREVMRVVTPSSAAGDDDPDARLAIDGPPGHADPAAHGKRVHLLLQLGSDGGRLPGGDDAASTEAAAVLADARFKGIFDPAADGRLGRSEVPVVAQVESGEGQAEERMVGVIDRLIVGDDVVEIIDYKTNHCGADAEVRANLVAHYTPQLALYRDAVARLYPGREVRTSLLFTDPDTPAADRLQEVHP